MKIKTLTYPSVFILILANSLPLLGILFFSWDVFSILLLYWLETIVIGFFNVLKMLAIGKEKAWPLILVFIIHYLIFNVVHLMLLIFIFAPRNILSNLWFLNLDELFNYLQTVIVALMPLFISHGFSLFFNFLKKKEYLNNKEYTHPHAVSLTAKIIKEQNIKLIHKICDLKKTTALERDEILERFIKINYYCPEITQYHKLQESQKI